jgi:tetratricopeptide (TPR) repeat protein
LVKGDKAYNEKEYAKALDFYKRAFESGKLPDKTTKYIHYPFRMAECCRMLGDIKNEEHYYGETVKEKCYPEDTIALVYWVDVEKLLKNYDAAIDICNYYRTWFPKSVNVDEEIKKCEEAKKEEENKTDSLKKN